MPELTEITNETPAKVEETEARIEDDDDDDSDTTIPELEDTGKKLALFCVHLFGAIDSNYLFGFFFSVFVFCWKKETPLPPLVKKKSI